MFSRTAVPDAGYIAAALAIAVVITVSLRAIPFGLRALLRESALVDNLGRWMPLGAVAILAVYCLAGIGASGVPGEAVGELSGVAVTVGTHLWRRNAVLSIALGAVVCLVIANVLPS
jgi:branched-subunit amino acid transport protein AzlD